MSFKVLSIAIITMISVAATAQKSFIKEANKHFRNESYAEAIKSCETAYKKIPLKNGKARALKADMAWKTAESYKLTNQPGEAIVWYERAVDLKLYKKNPEVYFRLGESLRETGDFEKAREQFEAYLELVPGSEKAKKALDSTEEAPKFLDNRTRYTVKNESKLNTPGMDMALTPSDRKGKTLVLSSTRKGTTGRDIDKRSGEPFFDIFQVTVDKNGNYTNVVVLEGDSINTEDNEAAVCFDGRYKKMFFTRCPREKKQDLGCDIWMSTLKGKKWDIPTKVNIKPHDSVSVGHPCVSNDGKFLIFASDMSGGQGGKDLWSTTWDKKTKSWSAPKNLGPEINTATDELFPTFAMNGDLLFASDGHVGIGGLDIFRATKDGENMAWSDVRNVGAPLNSKDNDYSMYEVDKRNGFFTSNRKKDDNLPDIYSYFNPPNLYSLSVICAEAGLVHGAVEGAVVEVTPEGGAPFKGVTNAKGKVFWEKQPNGTRYINEEKNYKIRILPKEGFHDLGKVQNISTVGLNIDQQFVVEMPMLPKTPIKLREVRYALGKADLLVDNTINSPDSLKMVFDLLEEYPGMVIKLVSHTDARGGDVANQDLSQRRAQSCVNYLVNDLGVNPERLVAVGMGEKAPRTIYKINGAYTVDKPAGNNAGGYETIVLTEAYINQYKTTDKETFELLHQFNRRTEGDVLRMDWKPTGAQ